MVSSISFPSSSALGILSSAALGILSSALTVLPLAILSSYLELPLVVSAPDVS